MYLLGYLVSEGFYFLLEYREVVRARHLVYAGTFLIFYCFVGLNVLLSLFYFVLLPLWSSQI